MSTKGSVQPDELPCRGHPSCSSTIENPPYFHQPYSSNYTDYRCRRRMRQTEIYFLALVEKSYLFGRRRRSALPRVDPVKHRVHIPLGAGAQWHGLDVIGVAHFHLGRFQKAHELDAVGQLKEEWIRNQINQNHAVIDDAFPTLLQALSSVTMTIQL